MGRLDTGETTGRGTRSRLVKVFVAVLSAVGLSLAALSGLPAFAQETEPTTTTTPAPEPTTTTAPAPDPTTTTGAAPASDTTTTAPPAPTTVPPGPEAQAGKLDPGEALVARPEFGALTGHQHALVQELQTATDLYALRRFALFDLARQVATANGVLAEARGAEHTAVMREIVVLAQAVDSRQSDTARAVGALDVHAEKGPPRATTRRHSHRAAVDARVATFRALRRRLAADRTTAQRARAQAEVTAATATARLAAQTQAVADALAARSAAESGIEDELGPDAVRARPDGITATLVTAQAGQPDPIVVGGIGQPIPRAALSSPFGLRNDPLSGGAGFHPGLDFAAGSGTPIHAGAAGVVVMAGDCGGYGNCVVIDHGNSLATLYGHQSEVHVQVGEHVDAGQVIGLVGSSGMSTGPHLHFEVRLHGIPIDPVLALPEH